MKNKKSISLLITLAFLTLTASWFRSYSNTQVLGLETEILPEVEQVQDVIVAGEGHIPAGFPHLPVYPAASLVRTANDENTLSGLWQSSEKLPVIIAWQMFRLYDAGFFMQAVPADPSNDRSQSFTAVKGDLTVHFSATSNGSVTFFTIDIPSN
jgi:hypothetical protein